MKIPNEGGWSFDNHGEIAGAFDNHVREQLPWYDLATGACAHIIRHFLPHDGVLYDIGASTGNITKSIKETIKERNIKVFAIEPSQEMVDIYQGEGEVLKERAECVDYERFDVAVLFLSLMFVPVSKREKLLSDLYSKLNKGGCMIIFDKTEPIGGYLSTVMYRLTLAGKVSTGTSPGEIVKKELSLSGVQIPVREEKHWRLVFKFGDFSGWVVEKE